MWRLLFLSSILWLAACGSAEPYHETFDEAGQWSTDDDSEVRGEVVAGVYEFEIKADDLTTWTTAGLEFEDGWYEVEATQLSGPDNNLYGMVFRADNEEDDFYAFQISGDGFAWIGRYLNGGEVEAKPIVGDWWFASEAIHQGAEVSNKLSVRAEKANLIFFVNDQEVGRVTDDAFSRGDIGLIVGSLGEGEVQIQFDNFKVSPLDN